MSALTRTGHEVDMTGHLLTTIGQDPVLRHVKLIAEPWDVSMDGYRLGEFPPPGGVDDQYRDTLRDFWRSDADGDGTWQHGWPAPPTSTSTTAARRTPRSTSSPRTTDSPCATSSPTHQAQRGQRRGQPRRHRQPPLVELWC